MFVGRGEFESPKPPKRHIKHELDAHLSTSTIADSSPLVSSKYIFERVRCFPLKVLLAFSSSSCPHILNYSEGFVLHLTLLYVFRLIDDASISLKE